MTRRELLGYMTCGLVGCVTFLVFQEGGFA